MLLETLQGVEGGGFIILQDSVSCSARPLLKSFVNEALRREETVHILGFEVSGEELRYGINKSHIQWLHLHDAYPDPLGWTNQSSFTINQFTTDRISSLLRENSQAKSVTLVIDSLSWILRHINPTALCQTLQQLKKAGVARTIIALLHTDLHQDGIMGSVCTLASSVITVTPRPRGSEALAKILQRTKSGKIMQDEEIYSITEDLMVMIHKRPNHPTSAQTDTDEPEMDPTANLTFNLRLSETELEAKNKLSLPFVFSKEKKSALLHSSHGSGRIFYEPDANDDIDQEDPDDDLDF